MKNDFARLGGVTVASAVLASLLTSSLFLTFDPRSSQPAASPASSNDSVLDQLQAQVEALISAKDTGKGGAGNTDPAYDVLTSKLTESYLDKEMSQDYVSDRVSNQGGYTTFLPYGNVFVKSIAFANSSLGKYTDYSTHPWDASNFNVWFSSSTTYTGTPVGGFGLLVKRNDVKLGLPATCEGEYSDSIKQVAGIFVQTFWSSKKSSDSAPQNPCQYVTISEPLLADNSNVAWDYVDVPELSYVRAYTFTYTDIPTYSSAGASWPQTMGGEPVLPTIFRRDPILLNQNTSSPEDFGADMYTIAIWLKRSCYTTVGGRECVDADKDEEAKLVAATIKKLSTDLTTRTVLQTNCFYGECY